MTYVVITVIFIFVLAIILYGMGHISDQIRAIHTEIQEWRKEKQ